MLILAGVSLNAIVGDNGIITNAQNANVKSGMAALEEWLQEEYVEYYENALESDNKIEFLNKMFNYNLLLKDGTRNYIINDGKVYYLLNKSCNSIPKEIKDGLIGGDTTEYSQYTRLIDVYGITKDLKVYYCNGETTYGNVENYDINPNAIAEGVNGDAGLKTAITDILSTQYGVTTGENGITLANASILRNLEIDGSKYSGITDVSGLGDLKNLKTLTLTNLTLTSLNGLEGIQGLNYLYLKNTTSNNFSSLASCLNLQYLYLYLPSTIEQTVADNQILYLGQGLRNASGLTKLEYFGISGDTFMFDDTISKDFHDPTQGGSYYNKLNYTSTSRSNVSNLGLNSEDNNGVPTGLAAFNASIKNNIKYLFLNNNSITNINALKDFSKIIELDLFCNSSLNNISSLTGKTSINYLTLHSCGLTSWGTLSGLLNLYYISVQNNAIENLNGLENSNKLHVLSASSCSLTDISKLDGKKSLWCLDLRSNTSLQDVSKIGECTGLTNLYLNSNEAMTVDSVKSALNTTFNKIITNSDGTTTTSTVSIFSQTQGLSGLPQKYWIYFESLASTLDYSYSTLKVYLEDDTDKFLNLEDRTNVKSLNLNGQTHLTSGELVRILSTMTGLEYLGLRNTQITSDSFVSSGSKLRALDLYGTNITTLSNINSYATELGQLITSNSSINFNLYPNVVNGCIENSIEEVDFFAGAGKIGGRTYVLQ